MLDDWFQERKTDWFQTDYRPGRRIPDVEIDSSLFAPSEIVRSTGLRFCLDERNKSPWITAVYNSQYHAERASINLLALGLRIYYPKSRLKLKEVQADWNLRQHLRHQKAEKLMQVKMAPAYGRYLFIQLPEDQVTFENIPIKEEFLEGIYNENNLSHIIRVDGNYSLTTNREIEENRNFHIARNAFLNPRTRLRFRRHQWVTCKEGTIKGAVVQILEDVTMATRLKKKIEVNLGTSGARHYVKIEWLEEIWD